MLLEKADIFEAQDGEYYIHRVPGLLITRSGAVLATVESRRGRGGDWDDNDVLMRRSLDGGITFEPREVVAASRRWGPGPISNFVMISDRTDGTVHALYCHNYSRVFHIRSIDDGASWSEPREITGTCESYRDEYPWHVIATGPGHGIQTASGRLVVPLWMSDGSGNDFGPGKLGHRPSVVGVVYSDDHGETWRRGDIVARTEGRYIHPNETTCVELADGRVLFNMRSESAEHRRLISTSPDGASGWSEPVFDEALLEPVCMSALVRFSLPKGGSRGRILFSNPHNLDSQMRGAGNVARDRKNLTVKLSYDECRTWPVSKTLEEGPSGYSDLQVSPEGAVLCIYERGTVDGSIYRTKSVALARFDLDWLTDGEDTGER